MILIRVLIALIVFALPSTAFGVDVPVRGWSHAKFGRLVFDWPSPSKYSARIENRNLIVRFEKPISARFGSALRNLREYVTKASITGNQRVARFTLAGDFKLRSFKNDNAIVLDLRRLNPANARQPLLGVRVGEHPSHTRLVFDWNRPVNYEAALTAGRLRLRFDKTAKIDLNALRRQLPSSTTNPKSITRGTGLEFALNVAGAPRLRHFRSGTKVVVDLMVKSDSASGQAPAKAPVAEPKASQSALLDAAQKAINDAKTKAATSGPRSLLPEPEQKPKQAPTEAPNTEEATKPSNQPEKPEPAAKATVANVPDQVAQASPPQSGERKRGGIIAQAFRDSKATEAVNSPGKSLVSLIIEWRDPVGAAVFQRAGFVWAVFDKRAPIDLAPLREAGRGIVSNLEQLPIGNATVLRMVPGSGFSPFARRDGTNWVIDFRRGKSRAEIQIPIDIDPDAEGGARVLFPAIDIGGVIRLPDPEVGDLIQVATVQASGQGVNGQRAYPEFQILASTQGIAVVGLNDDLEIEKEAAGLAMTVPGGLHVSGISPNSVVGRGTRVGRSRRIFRLAEWRSNNEKDYYEARQKLQNAVARLPRERRDAARMRLAQFYFARGLAPEAKGILEVIGGADVRADTKPEFKAIKGAVAALNSDFEVAARNLNDPRLDKYEEIQLWRGVAAAQAARWKDAQLLFKQGDAVLHGYPDPLKGRIGLLRVDTALKARDSGTAARWLTTLDKQSENMTRGEEATLRYLQGRLAFVEQDIDRATDLWTELQESGDTWNAARAQLSLVNMGLLQTTMDADEAIKRLEKLRYQWRGDEFEMQVLRRLGGLYLDRNDYRGGLGTYRVIATYFPRHPDTKRIAEVMTDTFKKLYLEGEADKLPPLTALALYDEFRELTPAGPEGNVMIQRLSERLVDVDLLNRAADLLQHQVKFRLQGEERAQVGAKLALIRLLDRNPKKAIEALRKTVFPRLPEQLDDDRRRIQARALFETGQVKEAIEQLAGDVSRNADLLRADIQWRSENWGEAAKVLQRLSGEPPAEGTTFDQAEAQLVLNWAVALRLDKDESGLEVVRALYGSAMAASPLSKAFEFIASASTSDEPLDLETITSRIADNGVFDAFLAEYLADNKKRLLKSPVTPVKPPDAAPAPPPQAAGQENREDKA